MSEVSVSSHRPLHSGKHASGSSQGRDQATPFEALLDPATPDPAPKKTPRADRPDRPDRPERGAPSRRANEADSDPRDPNAVCADNEPAPEAATAASDSADTNAGTETGEPAADTETDASQTAKTEETAGILAAMAEPAAQPIAAPAVAAAIAAAPVTAEMDAATELTGVKPAGEAASPDAALAAPAETATPDQAADGLKPKAAKASAESSATDKPAADKAQAQSETDDDTAAPAHRDTALAQKKAAPTADGDAKPEAPAKPRADPDALRADADTSPRDHAAKPAADPLQTATLANTQTQAAHSASGSSAANGPQQTAPAVPVAGLAVEIAAQARAGKNRFEIRLDPPELGRIDVRLDVDKDGNVTSRLMVERADTLDLLRRDAQQLERALNQAGLKTADNALEFQLRDQGFTNNNNNRDGARDGAQLVIPDDEFPVVDAARGYGRLLGLGNGLDISV